MKYTKEQASQFDQATLNRIQKEAKQLTPDEIISKIQYLQVRVDCRRKGWQKASVQLPIWKFVADMAEINYLVDTSQSELQKVVDEDVYYAGLYAKKKGKAEDRGIKWLLTFAQYKRLMKRKTCAYTGLPFTEENFKTLDRINIHGPYEISNTVTVCNLANQVKNTLFEDPRQKGNDNCRISFDNMQKLMKGLEKHGFDKLEIER